MTLIRYVTGIMEDPDDGLKKVKMLCHFTSDDLGETLSLSYGDLQLTCRYKEVEAIVKKERGYGYKNGHLIINEADEYIPVDWLKENGGENLIEIWRKSK